MNNNQQEKGGAMDLLSFDDAGGSDDSLSYLKNASETKVQPLSVTAIS